MVMGTFWGTYKDLIALVVTSSIASAALLVAWGQARNGRLLDLHEKITTGELRGARNRLAAHLYENNQTLAARFVWSELQALNTTKCPTCQVSLDDFYALIWFFQRMNRAVRTPVIGAVTGLVPYRGTKEMLDWHIVWWAIAFEDITSKQARFSTDLQTLSVKIDPERTVYAEASKRFQERSAS